MLSAIPLIVIIAILLLFLFSSTIVILSIYLKFRPHRAKLFFSYSHKDSDIAQRIMRSLKDYNFRIWIDLGIEIPAEQLERELSRIISKREIFLLLASKNSADSYWVKFELEQSRRLTQLEYSHWRDTVILALDDSGAQLYDTLIKLNEETVRRVYYNDPELKLYEKTPSELAEVEVSARKALKFVEPQPFFRRGWAPSIKLFDLRESFELSMRQLSDYLAHSTRLLYIPSKPLYAKFIRGFLIYNFLCWLIVMVITGIFLIIALINLINS